jgi:hypothetical protein
LKDGVFITALSSKPRFYASNEARKREKSCESIRNSRIPKFPGLWAIFSSTFPSGFIGQTVAVMELSLPKVPDEIFPVTVTG